MNETISTIQILLSNPLFASTFGIIGFVAAYFYYVKSKRVKKLSFDKISRDIVKDYTDKINGLKISFNNNPIESLAVTRIVLWNEGTETINGSDIAKSDPLHIRFEEDQVLGASVVFSSNPANLISVTQDSADKNNIRLDFDYIDPGDSCVVQIIHVGRKASKIDITGSIKGAGRPQKNSVPRDSYADKKLSWKIGDIIFSFLIPTLLGGMTLIGIFGTKNIGGRVALILLFLPICFGFFHAVSETVRKFKSPRGHEKFHEKI